MMMKSLHLLVFFLLLFVITHQHASIDGHDQQLAGALLMKNPSMNARSPMPYPKVDHRPVHVFNKVNSCCISMLS